MGNKNCASDKIYYKKAFKVLKLLANKGDANVQFNLGLMYYNGQGVEKNEREAMKWWLKSGAQGFALAAYNLALIYEYGVGIIDDQKKANKLYTVLAKEGFPLAMYKLGTKYLLSKDYKKALKWLNLAATSHTISPEAKFHLGVMYKNAQGVKQNYTKAIKFWNHSAINGFAPAQFNLGLLYYEGQGGLTKDKKKAIKWWLRAAESGLVKAQSNLGIVYQSNHQEFRDLVQAYKWFSIAILNGDKTANKYMYKIKNSLSPSQKTKGKLLAKEWFNKHK